jgi:hypothetical protein
LNIADLNSLNVLVPSNSGMASHKSAVDVDISAGVFLFLGVIAYLRWSKEQLQFFKVALELSRGVRGEFGGGTVSSGQHSGWCGHGNR